MLWTRSCRVEMEMIQCSMSHVRYTQGLIAILETPVSSDETNDRLYAMGSEILVNYDGTIAFLTTGTRGDHDGPGLTLMENPLTLLDAFMSALQKSGLYIKNRESVQFFASVYSDNTDDYMMTSKVKDGKIVQGD